jgi:hypothetical protein
MSLKLTVLDVIKANKARAKPTFEAKQPTGESDAHPMPSNNDSTQSTAGNGVRPPPRHTSSLGALADITMLMH